MNHLCAGSTRINPFCKQGWTVTLLAWSTFSLAAAGLDWPADHLLPTFPAPAPMIDCIELKSAPGPEVDLFASLEGIINRTQPRIACTGARDGEGETTWLKIHRLQFQMVDGFHALQKYKSEVKGLVVDDPDRPETLNLATTLAGLGNALICHPDLLSKLTNAPYDFKILEDLRGRFSSGDEVYDYLLKNVWPRSTHRVIAGLSPRTHGNLRDYLVALNATVVWLDPKDAHDAKLLAKFTPDLKPAAALYMGWWPDEDSGLRWIGQYGIPVVASDFFMNGSLFGGVTEKISPPPVAPPPPLQNKIYVALFLSDGDNVQYMQHALQRLWNDPARGKVPIGWTVSPLAVDLDPAMLNFYYHTATTNDCLVSGPSGAGYARLDFWKPADLDAFTKITNPYLERSGIGIITVWMRVNNQIGNSFAANCPALLGVISHEGGSRRRVYGNLPMIGLAAGANYTSSVAGLRTGIEKAANGWDGKEPWFIAAQGNAWDVKPSGLLSLAESLDTNKFVVVRPDHLFQLFNAWRKNPSPTH